MIESKPVPEFVGEKRLEVVGALALRSGERAGSCVDRLLVVSEQGVGIENLAGKSGRSAHAHRNSGRVRGDDTREGQDARGERCAGLVETDRVEAVDVILLIVRAGICGADARDRSDESRVGGAVEGGASDARPNT